MVEIEIDKIRPKIHILSNAVQVEQISKGYSMENKYLVTTDDNEKILLRIIPIEQYARKREEFDVIKNLYFSEVKVPKPITFGQCEDFHICYYVLSYIEGADAAESLVDCSADEQYEIGLQAGRDLHTMHKFQAPKELGTWYERAIRKHRNYVAAYKDIGITLRHADRILEFIVQNEGYIRNRPNRFQHDDFHVGNIIVNNRTYAGTIDFNRFDWGDPVHDFLKVGFFSSEVSVPFCVGQLHGYFNDEAIPDWFWRLYSIYVAMTMFSSIVWTMRVVPHEIDGMLRRIYRVLDDHQNFESIRPGWYFD